jgi:hypothetical protein
MKFATKLLISFCLVALAVGCTTVTPRQVESPTASWDGTNQNSGFIGWTADGSGIITPHARDRYNGLIDIYGKRFIPPLVFDYGIQPTAANTFTITPEALSDFATMNRWRKKIEP